MTDWAVGDLAVCVCLSDLHPYWRKRTKFREGAVYRVDGVVINPRTGDPCLVIGEPDIFTGTGYPFAHRFRKIRPDEHEGNAEDWALLLETAKPKQLEPISEGKK